VDSSRAPPGVVVRALFELSRPEQLLLVELVYATGVVAAAAQTGAPLDPVVVAGGGFVLAAAAASVHYANEYADHETDLLTVPTRFSGGSGVFRRTRLSRRFALMAALGALGVGSTGTAVLAAWGLLGAPALGLLAVGTALGWAYSVEPVALVRRGVGEVTNAAIGAVALPAYGYAVAAGSVDAGTALLFVPFGLVTMTNLLMTHWPDREADARTGKATLAVRWSRTRLRRAYWTLTVAAYGSLLLSCDVVLPPRVCLAGFVAMPLSVWGGLVFTRHRSPAPAVSAMVLFLLAQAVAWTSLAVAQ
jgi:1,4-dihydroxy-2-naphthoate octaprenyltransferase